MSGTISQVATGGGSDLRRWVSTTPGTLRVLSVVIVAAVMIVTSFAYYTVAGKVNSIGMIGHRTVPAIIDAQKIHAALVDADRNAASSFLYGGEGINPAREQYNEDIDLATVALQQASQHTAYGDEAAQPLNTALTGIGEYRELMGWAFTNNRLGHPVSQAYLHAAHDLMIGTILPAVEELGRINSEHLAADLAATQSNTTPLGIVIGVSGLGLAVLVYTQITLAKRFRRRFNLQLVAATALLMALMGWSSVGIVQGNAHLSEGTADHYAQLNRLWQIRSLVTVANLNGSLSLIARGNGAAYDQAFIEANAGSIKLGAELQAAATSGEEGRAIAQTVLFYQLYLEADEQVRALEAAGQHDKAVALALSTGEGGLNSQFTQLEEALADVIDIKQADFDKSISAADNSLAGLNVGIPLLALAIAGLSLWGLQKRINEYKF